MASSATTASHARRWLANVLFGYGDAALGALVYVALTPMLVRFLGVEAYALWIFSHTICFYLQFLDIGLSAAQVRYHAGLAALQNTNELNKLSATVTVGMTIAGAIGMLGGIAIACIPHGGWYETPTHLQADFRLALSLLAINLLVTFPGTVLNNIYDGAQRFDLRNLRSIALRVTATAAQLYLLYSGFGIVALAASELACTSVRVIVDVLIIRRVLPGLLEAPVYFHRDVWRSIRRFAMWSSADELLVEGTPRLDQLFLALTVPIGLLTPYSLCTAMAGALIPIVHPIIATFLPMASTAHAQNRNERLPQMFVDGSKLCLTLATPAAIFFAFFGERILGLWIPESSGQISAGLLQLIVANVLTSVFVATPTVILTAVNGIRTVVLLTLAELGVTLVLALLLVSTWGLTGIAAACLITNAGVALCVLIPIVARTLKQNPLSLIYASLSGVFLSAVPAAVFAGALTRLWPQPSWPQLVLAGCSIGALFLLAMLGIGTNKKEREHYLLLWRKARNKSPPADISLASRG